ncbi:glycosyltransferase family 2 protein [Salipiger sp.]|uniref:glycosyltransferase family 2 protein n=1 Tax=Salipiger sp. TaxID=2078585 RepID=UPI003A96BBCD
MTTWGTVTTTNAHLPEILDFAAWHLEQGAHRIYVYLDDDMPEAEAALGEHPALRVFRTDDAWWQERGRRPAKHQVRQTANARHANSLPPEVDWLAHIDTDEFLMPRAPLGDQLAALPQDCLCARVRPVEALAPLPGTEPGLQRFKAFHLDQKARQADAEACFPPWGQHLSGGFLSHVAGKMLFRAGTEGLQIRIHNVELDGQTNPGQRPLNETELGHFHAADWERFLLHYRFRMEKGSYRAELKPQGRGNTPLTLHDFFSVIEEEGGEAALRVFFEEVCTATPDLVARLSARGLLRKCVMDFPALRARHFPHVTTTGWDEAGPQRIPVSGRSNSRAH